MFSCKTVQLSISVKSIVMMGLMLSLLLPFLEVILHSVMDILRRREEQSKEVKAFDKTIKVLH